MVAACLLRDAAVIGCCAYQAGGAEDFSEMFAALAGYIGRTPTPAPEADPVVGAVPVPEPEPMRQYARTIHLLPQACTYSQRFQVDVEAWPRRERDAFDRRCVYQSAAMHGAESLRVVGRCDDGI